ncbi:MAG: Metallophosphoesterase [Parcubacteria group bacterium GW2011_GWA2_43_13]|nr:MAG: Metallophosphoesterase [Parcubacteria group bacterium GW2011_GWA2_43_13]OGY69455.1 MAG: hypothetical protein A3B94_03215 [Candidatus Jacksonbacteria bacterium RIFCSPHIGHO2_02_FULL_43_10]OGY71336.1 MAG: hypothetical protein A2986_03680 [Candidatus Jacksonbacteria bacterium RIFCSPLOWO2_01_FULL_44_13]HAZ17039.1 hypothetical protein [Candidatus Jacksonbacteria bacterium]
MNDQSAGDVTVVLSDLHLGDVLCRAKLLLDFLCNRHFSLLILNGDIFADSEIEWRDLPAYHKKVLVKIGELMRQGVRVVWVAGNHDLNIGEILRRCSGHMGIMDENLSMCTDSYAWEHERVSCIATHGHQWNPLDQLNGWFTILILLMFDFLKKIDVITGWRLTRLLSRNAFFWKRSNRLVQNGALKFTRKDNPEVVCCGHTHDRVLFKIDGVIYANTGCWTDRLPTALILTKSDIILYAYSWIHGWRVRAHIPLQKC